MAVFSSCSLAGLCLLVLISSCSSTNNTDDEERTEPFLWDGELRTYELHVPASYQASSPAPLVLAFHGSGDTGRGFQQGTRFDVRAAEQGFITVYPNSVVSNWAEGCGCNNADRLEIDDIGFTKALIDTVSAHYTIDPARIYVLGFSQGGLYVQRVACEMADQVAAVATVAATMSVPLSQTCTPADPISMLVMHGTADTVLPYGGTIEGALSLLSAPATLDLWRRHNDCSTELQTTTERIDADRDLRHDSYSSCVEDTQVHLYSIVGGRHTWPSGSFDANTVIMDFFANQPK